MDDEVLDIDLNPDDQENQQQPSTVDSTESVETTAKPVEKTRMH